MSSEPQAWPIQWSHCLADESDVKYDRSLPKAEQRGVKVGETLWRAAVAVGPISCDHNHWVGEYLTGEPAEIAMMSAAPLMLKALEEVLLRAPMSHHLKEQVEKAIATAKDTES